MDVCPQPSGIRLRWKGIYFGIATQLLFIVTVWKLFWFLRDGVPAQDDASLLIDGLLSLQFTVIHSWLLLPGVKRRITKFVPTAFYGCFFCLATCLGLLAMFAGWQASSSAIWNCTGTGKTFMSAGFYGSWLMLLYSLSLTGFGYQTGLTPWLHWLRGLPQPRRNFQPRGAYLIMRHPVYLSFLGLIWFTPRMTFDHAMLTFVWTIYIFVGSYLKDERLAFYIGKTYRDYQSCVPSFPWFGIGSVGVRIRKMLIVESVIVTATVRTRQTKRLRECLRYLNRTWCKRIACAPANSAQIRRPISDVGSVPRDKWRP